MTTTLIALAVLAGAALYFMTPMERMRLRSAALATLQRLAVIASKRRADPLADVLRARTRWVVVVPGLAAINIVIFAKMLLDAPAIGDPQALIAWGANFAPRTTNNEWWRLVTSSWVHAGFFSLVIDLAALLSAGLVLERLIGPVTLIAVYLAAAALSSLAGLWISPVAVITGASGAIFGLYGLLLACWMWGTFQGASTTVRLESVKRLAIPAGLFVLYHLVTDDMATNAEVTGLVIGFLAGLVLTRWAAQCKPSVRRLAPSMAAVAVIAVASAEPLRGLVDARPEMTRVIQMEERTAGAYNAAVRQFQKGWTSTGELSRLIDRKIVPELQDASRRVKTLGRVPTEHRPMVTAAERYLQLREDAWRFRAKAVSRSSAAMLREADKKEQAALDALRNLVSASGHTPGPQAP